MKIVQYTEGKFIKIQRWKLAYISFFFINILEFFKKYITIE